MKLKRVVKDWCTEGDGETYDPMPVLAIVVTVFILVVSAHSYFARNSEFNILDFGAGIAAVWAGAAGGSRLRPQTFRRENYNYTPGAQRTSDLE